VGTPLPYRSRPYDTELAYHWVGGRLTLPWNYSRLPVILLETKPRRNPQRVFNFVAYIQFVEGTCTPAIITLELISVFMSPNPRLDRVLAQLRLYEHPLLDFDARAKRDSVELIIQFKNPRVPVHTYYFDLHPRDLDHPQFEWTFQRQLYDCLHDYLVEMFIRTPQDRIERQREGL
jgi:hypothetical protein